MDTLSNDIVINIKKNIYNNNRKDLQKYGIKGTFTYEDYIQKIKDQNNKCYICLQEFKYDGGKWCYFFPSCDRIYNYSPHTKENIAIACLFCNIRMFKGKLLKCGLQKKCGDLCEGLNHAYDGDIITKSILFRNLGHNNNRIKEYINTLFISKPDNILCAQSTPIPPT